MTAMQQPGSDEPVLSLWQRIEPKHVFTIAVLSAVAGLLFLARDHLGPYVLGVVLAYLVLPFARRIMSLIPEEGRLGRWRESLSVLLAFFLTLAVLAILFVLLAVQIADGVQELADNFPGYWQDMTEDGEIGNFYQEEVPPEAQVWIDENIDSMSQKLLGAATSILEFAFEATGSIVSAFVALIIMPIFAVYFLLGRPGTPEWIRRTLPESWADDAIEVLRITDRSLGAYTRGVLITSVIVGAITGAGYWIIGVDLWLALSVVAFAGEVVPIIGPWIAFFISFPVILVTEPELAIPAVILFGIVQALEGWFISPKIQGDSIDFSAAAILLILALGSAIGGPIGVVIALPAAAVARALVVYTLRRMEGARPHVASHGLFQIEEVHADLDEAPAA